MNLVKILLAIALIIAGIAGYYHFSEVSILARYGMVVVAVILGIAVASSSTQGRTFWKFAFDAKNEVKKIIWPTAKETTQVTTWVVIVVFLVGLMIWLIDLALVKIIYGLVLGIEA